MDRKERLKNLVPVLTDWYVKNGRSLPWREDPSPYHVWISEIMLQQTRIEAVKPYYARFLREIPDVKTLANADPEHLHKLWEGLGYYSRVRNLQKAAVRIMEEFGGEFPRDYAGIRSLCGIGDYTAGAIASICFDLPVPAVDGNVLRVLSRITGDERPVTEEKTKASVREDLAAVYPATGCGAFTQALMELGETVCIPNGEPSCASCPCRELCLSRDGGWVSLPVKGEKKKRRSEDYTVFLLRCDGKLAVRKRPAGGLLSELWELPNVPGDLSPEDALRRMAEQGAGPCLLHEEFREKHVFTHVEWRMHCYSLSCGSMPDCFVWADARELEEAFALPTAFRKLLAREADT